eukprot:s4673_g4.t2
MVDDTLRASPEHEKFRAARLERALNASKALAGALRGGIQGGVLDGDRGTISVGPEKSEKLVLAPSGHPELDGGGPQKMGGAGYFCGCLPSGPSLPSSRRILRDQQPTARLQPRAARQLSWPAQLGPFAFLHVLRSRSNQAVQYLQEQLASPHSTSSDRESRDWAGQLGPFAFLHASQPQPACRLQEP